MQQIDINSLQSKIEIQFGKLENSAINRAINNCIES